MVKEEFNPTRLALARRRRGMNRAEVGASANLAYRTIRAYEKGVREPSRDVVAKFASTLAFPIEFFYGPPLEEPLLDGVSFRALSNLTAHNRNQALAGGALAFALSDWIDERFEIPGPSVPTYSDIDPENAAMVVRSEWGLGERPIPNMLHLLEAHGVRVYSVPDSASLDAYSLWRGNTPYVFLNTTKSSERTRMDAAHELGHLVLHSRGGFKGNNAEKQARIFASVFLMPRGSILAESPRNGSLTRLIHAKRRWNVSLAALVYRMHELRMLTKWHYQLMFMEIGRLGYRTSEPNSAPDEISQVLVKVFSALREEGIPMSNVAKQLRITTNELSSLVLGIIFTPMFGHSTRSP